MGIKIVGFQNSSPTVGEWRECVNPHNMGYVKKTHQKLYKDDSRYLSYLKNTNKVCSPLFGLFVPVRASSLLDVTFPLTGRYVIKSSEKIDKTYKCVAGVVTLLIDLITLIFRMALLIPRAIYNAIESRKSDMLLKPTCTTGINGDQPVIVEHGANKFYYCNRPIHEAEAYDYFEHARSIKDAKRFGVHQNANETESAVLIEIKDVPNVNVPDTPIFINGIRVACPREAQMTTLWNLREMSEQQRQEAIVKFELNDQIAELGGYEAFLNELKKSEKDVLEKLTITNLKLSKTNQLIHFAFMKEEEFEKLTVQSIKKLVHPEITAIIHLRLKHSRKVEAAHEDLMDLEKCSLVKFYHLPFEELYKIRNDIPFYLFPYLSHENSNKLLEKEKPQKPPVDNFQKIKINDELSCEFVNEQLDQLSVQQLNELKDKHLQGLQISEKYADETVKKIFEGIFNLHTNVSELKRRVALLPSAVVNRHLDKFSYMLLPHLSDAHIRDLDGTRNYPPDVMRKILMDLFGYGGNKDKRIGLLSSDFVNKYLDDMNGSQLGELTKEQIANIKKISPQQLANLFPGYNLQCELRFACLSKEIVLEMFDKMNRTCLQLISPDQFKCLDFTKVSKEKLDQILPEWEMETLINQWKAKRNGFADRWKAHERILNDISTGRKEANLKKLQALNPEQRLQIVDKLSEDNQKLVGDS